MSDEKPFFLGGNTLPIKFFIGPTQVANLINFCKKAGLKIPSSEDQLVARLAPSVVTRGEVQLFNLDVPRFSVRVYLDDNQGFINLRRMAEVINRLEGEAWIVDTEPTTLAYRTPNENVPYHKPPKPLPNPQAIFREFYADGEQNVIADCLFNVPQKFIDTHDFVTADLGWVYGEGESREAVPYVCAMKGFSGGACAQACAFIVSSLLHEYPPNPKRQAGIHGLAEITAMTTPPGFDLMLRGLRLDVLAEYFVKAGRIVMKYSRVTVDTSLGVISAHIRSNFSPILAVARGDKGTFNHMVVAVGAVKSGAPELIIHDPSDYPFLSWNSRKYADNCAPSTKLPATFCVLPSRISCPLVKASIVSMDDDVRPLERRLRYGVFEMAEAMAPQKKDGGPPELPPKLSDFTLVQLLLVQDGPSNVINSIPVGIVDAFRDASLHSFWQESAELASLAGRWVWLQKIHHQNLALAGITLWDAELQPNGPEASLDRCKAHLLYSIVKGQNGWEVQSFAKEKAKITDSSCNSFKKPARGSDRSMPDKVFQNKTGANQTLLASCIITSFTAIGLGRAFGPNVWPSGKADFAEVYAFMHCDTSLFDRELNRFLEPGSLPSAVERLSGLCSTSAKTNLTAHGTITSQDLKHVEQEDIARTIKSYAKRVDVKIRAFATHMPQLYSENRRQAIKARKALCTLAQVREKLKGEHDIRVIEISAGSRVRGLIPRMSAEHLKDVNRGCDDRGKPVKIHDKLTFFASRRTELQSLDILISRLNNLVRHMKKATSGLPHERWTRDRVNCDWPRMLRGSCSLASCEAAGDCKTLRCTQRSTGELHLASRTARDGPVPS